MRRLMIFDEEFISFEEYLIYFKFELMLNAKLSHLPNSLIRSHSAFTRKWSGLSEMAICVKVFGFRPNWPLHNKIMVAGFIYNIFQKHQNVTILDISNIEPTPPRKLSASLMALGWPIHNLFTSFWILRQIYDTWFLNFFYVDVSLKLAILHHNKYWRLEIFDQYFTLRCNISNVAKML